MATYTLLELRNKMKRRLHLIRATTSASADAESGNIVSDNQIDQAINAGRKKLMIAVRNAELWGRAEAYFATVSNIQEYILGEGLLRVDAVHYGVTSEGKSQVGTKHAVDVIDREGEEACIRSPSDHPSVTNPKYRIYNIGVRLIVSTDGTVPADIYILVEYLKELTDLSGDDTESGITDTLNEIIMDYAVYYLFQTILPQQAQQALANFQQQVQLMNFEKFRLDVKRRVR